MYTTFNNIKLFFLILYSLYSYGSWKKFISKIIHIGSKTNHISELLHIFIQNIMSLGLREVVVIKCSSISIFSNNAGFLNSHLLHYNLSLKCVLVNSLCSPQAETFFFFHPYTCNDVGRNQRNTLSGRTKESNIIVGSWEERESSFTSDLRATT
jgi:hypothetical protein